MAHTGQVTEDEGIVAVTDIEEEAPTKDWPLALLLALLALLASAFSLRRCSRATKDGTRSSAHNRRNFPVGSRTEKPSA